MSHVFLTSIPFTHFQVPSLSSSVRPIQVRRQNELRNSWSSKRHSGYQRFGCFSFFTVHKRLKLLFIVYFDSLFGQDHPDSLPLKTVSIIYMTFTTWVSQNLTLWKDHQNLYWLYRNSQSSTDGLVYLWRSYLRISVKIEWKVEHYKGEEIDQLPYMTLAILTMLFIGLTLE